MQPPPAHTSQAVTQHQQLAQAFMGLPIAGMSGGIPMAVGMPPGMMGMLPHFSQVSTVGIFSFYYWHEQNKLLWELIIAHIPWWRGGWLTVHQIGRIYHLAVMSCPAKYGHLRSNGSSMEVGGRKFFWTLPPPVWYRWAAWKKTVSVELNLVPLGLALLPVCATGLTLPVSV